MHTENVIDDRHHYLLFIWIVDASHLNQNIVFRIKVTCSNNEYETTNHKRIYLFIYVFEHKIEKRKINYFSSIKLKSN